MIDCRPAAPRSATDEGTVEFIDQDCTCRSVPQYRARSACPDSRYAAVATEQWPYRVEQRCSRLTHDPDRYDLDRFGNDHPGEAEKDQNGEKVRDVVPWIVGEV